LSGPRCARREAKSVDAVPKGRQSSGHTHVAAATLTGEASFPENAKNPFTTPATVLNAASFLRLSYLRTTRDPFSPRAR
jgi:hypothetical protein